MQYLDDILQCVKGNQEEREMVELNINGIQVRADSSLPIEEIQLYIKEVKEKNKNKRIKAMTIELDNEGYVNVRWEAAVEPFERIRRITGYLVGTTDRWNDAKSAELKDRVKHTGLDK